MKYAIQYNSKFRHLSEVDEIIFHNLDELKEYAAGSDNLDQRLIYYLKPIDREDYTNIINEIININKEIKLTILCNMKSSKKYLSIFKENNIPFFFEDFATTKEVVDAMGQMGAISVYIVEGLAFNLKALQHMKEIYGFSYRVLPDVAQYPKGLKEYVLPLKRFFIRPEDTEIYEEYVDIFEFWHTDKDLSVIYEVYKQQQWLGDLQAIVGGLEKTIDNKTIAPYFGKMRLTCDKVCLEGKCYLCEEMEKLAERFAEANLEIVKKRKKPIRTDEEIEKGIEELAERGKELLNESSTNEETV